MLSGSRRKTHRPNLDSMQVTETKFTSEFGLHFYRERVLNLVDVPQDVWDVAASLTKMVQENIACLNIERSLSKLVEIVRRQDSPATVSQSKLLKILQHAELCGYFTVFLIHSEF